MIQVQTSKRQELKGLKKSAYVNLVAHLGGKVTDVQADGSQEHLHELNARVVIQLAKRPQYGSDLQGLQFLHHFLNSSLRNIHFSCQIWRVEFAYQVFQTLQEQQQLVSPTRPLCLASGQEPPRFT